MTASSEAMQPGNRGTACLAPLDGAPSFGSSSKEVYLHQLDCVASPMKNRLQLMQLHLLCEVMAVCCKLN